LHISKSFCTFVRKIVDKRIIKIVLLLSCVGFIVPARAQYVGSGSSAFNFLSLPVSARMTALGGTNVSMRDGDISMAMANPALLGQRTHMVLNLNFAYLMQGTMFGSAIYGHNFKENNYFMVGVHYLDYGKMKYADENGNLTGGSFGARDIAIHATYARQLGPHFTVGVTLKPVLSFYESYNSFALGADIGGHFQMADSTLQVGLSLNNIGWQLKNFYSLEGGRGNEILPLNLQLGINYKFKHAPIRLGLTLHDLQWWSMQQPIAMGVGDLIFSHTIFSLEVVPRSERFYIALSYNHRRRVEMNLADQRSLAGFSLGAGVRISKLHVDFAVTQLTKSNFTFQVGLSLDIASLMNK